jgi:hypothetical protein
MTKIIKIWHRTTFWTKIEKSFLYIGSSISGTMVLTDAGKLATLIVIGSTIAGGLVGFWMTDANKDGIIDIIQDDHRSLN